MVTLKRPPKPGSDRPDARVDWSRLREMAISAVIVVMLATAIFGALPKSTIKSTAAPVFTPIARASGLDQGWGVFAPNPPRLITELEVHVVMRDGEDRIWRLNADRSLPEYRWRKLKEAVVKHKQLRPGFAQWVVREVTDENDQPGRVLIVLQTESLPLAGQGEPKVTRKLLLNQRVASSR